MIVHHNGNSPTIVDTHVPPHLCHQQELVLVAHWTYHAGVNVSRGYMRFTQLYNKLNKNHKENTFDIGRT
jgi:hypothetical protein